ncbi:MAG: class I SAM-dependent methyltransferase [Lentisphaerae bacterium]|nr:class I SAM-dependent methyltransferase [Lentisphaerota bacterium]
MNQVQPAKVKGYWEKIAAEFDTIYSGEKSPFKCWLDKVFRADMYERYRLTVEECGADSIRSVLDVGTGSGRFCLPLAKGKERILGVDFSQPMIDIAKKRAEEAGVAEKCDFRVADFMELELDEAFDAVIAIGVFDYINKPVPFLSKMAKTSVVKVVATFPILWSWRAPVRWVRLNLAGCPVYFFTEAKVRKLCAESGLAVKSLKRVGKIHFLVATPAQR